MATPKLTLEIDGHEVSLSNPDKVYFPAAQITKREIADYYLAVGEGAIRGVARRPQIMKRYVNGVGAEPFYQKRVPDKHPDFIDTATFTFPSGRSAVELVTNNRAALVWAVNLGCIDLNPHAVRAEHMEHPDELRIDLDPVPGVLWPQIVETARVAKQTLDDLGLIGWPKTSGSRGAHIWVRITPEHPFATVRRAAQALAREIARRAPAIATAKWWKEERHGVFVDYNQNARDRTTASAYSVRGTPDARVSMPLSWDDFFTCDPAAYTLRTVPAIYAQRGDAHAGIDDAVCSLAPLLELADRDEEEDESSSRPDGDAPPGKKKAAKPARKKLPVITIAQAKQKPDALAGLERWKAAHADIVPLLKPEHVLVDTNRGRATAWYRIRINLIDVPEAQRPAQTTPDPDYDWRTEYGDWLTEGRRPEE